MMLIRATNCRDMIAMIKYVKPSNNVLFCDNTNAIALVIDFYPINQ